MDRIGVTKEWDKIMTPGDKQAYAQSSSPQHAGVDGTEELLRCIWNRRFAAGASDAISFHDYPPRESYPREDGQEVEGRSLHEYLLARWGMPIGEMFDLEDLSCICEEEKRREFIKTSASLNIPGGVRSPPIAIANF